MQVVSKAPILLVHKQYQVDIILTACVDFTLLCLWNNFVTKLALNTERALDSGRLFRRLKQYQRPNSQTAAPTLLYSTYSTAATSLSADVVCFGSARLFSLPCQNTLTEKRGKKIKWSILLPIWHTWLPVVSKRFILPQLHSRQGYLTISLFRWAKRLT
jgi:hypothetical protein